MVEIRRVSEAPSGNQKYRDEKVDDAAAPETYGVESWAVADGLRVWQMLRCRAQLHAARIELERSGHWLLGEKMQRSSFQGAPAPYLACRVGYWMESSASSVRPR